MEILSNQQENYGFSTFHTLDPREDMQVSLHNKGFLRIILGTEAEPHHPAEKNKFMNRLDESFGYLCTHISRDLLFHLEGLWTPKEYWEKLEVLFEEQDKLLRGHILENMLIALHPSSFDTIQQFFTKFKSLVLQCRHCGIEIKEEKHVLSILSKLGIEYSLFVSILHSGSASIPSLDSFSKSLIQE